MKASSISATGLGIFFAIAMFVPAIAHGDPTELKGKAAPGFTLNAAKDVTSTSLSKMKGKVVVLDFWATWCPPCRASLPHLQKMSEDEEMNKKGLRVFAVNCGEAKDKIEPFMTENKYTFSALMDSDQKVKAKYQVEGIPTTVVIGRHGKIRAVFVGWYPDDAGKSIDKAVEAALKEK